MVVTRLSRWMTWSTCEWLRWWLLDSVAGWPEPSFQVELETRFAAQAQTCQWYKLRVSQLEQQIWSQTPLGNRALVYLWVTEMVVTRLSCWMTWSTWEWMRWSLLAYWVVSANQYGNCLLFHRILYFFTVFCIVFHYAILNKMCTERIKVFPVMF